MISIGNQELDKVYIGSQEMDKVYIGSTLVFEKSTPPTPPTPTTLTWSPNPFYMNNVSSWGTVNYVLATATAPASGRYDVYLNAYWLENTYYSAAQVQFRIYNNGLQSGSFSLSYQSQNLHGEQSVPLSIYASAGDVITIEYKYSDNVSGNFNLDGSVSIS